MLNSHYEAWSYKRRKYKKIGAYRKSVQKEPTVKDYLCYVAQYSLLYPNIAIIYEKDDPYKHFDLVWFDHLFFWPSLLILSFSNNACADRGLSKMICGRKIIYAYDIDININKIRLKRNVEFQEDPPTIYYKWKCISTMRIFVMIILDVCLHKIKH